MLFGKRQKVEKALERSKDRSSIPARLRSGRESYGAMVKRQFRKNRLAIWAMRILYGLIFIAVFGDMIANEKPLYCKIEGQTYFPVFRQYLVDLGLAKWDARFINNDWASQNYDSVIYPLIPYSALTLDIRNSRKGPFDDQEIESNRFRHWFGTDGVGRDVAAGMIRGTRIALMVGLISMGIASIIGLFFGGLAGYFGDDKLKVSRVGLVLYIVGIILGVFYGFTARSYQITEVNIFWGLLSGFFIFLLIMTLTYFIVKTINRIFPTIKKISLPVDILVMRLIEVMNSIPGLVFLLALLAIIEKSTITSVMIIIGLIGWTGIARFVRSELLRVRSLDFIEAARSLGLSDFRILWRHALPNALTPILISISFGVAGAILTEAFLSFLGIGIPTEEVTWGRLLYYSRSNMSAWWLAIFPGFAIFITITLFNLIGEGLTDALNPKQKQ